MVRRLSPGSIRLGLVAVASGLVGAFVSAGLVSGPRPARATDDVHGVSARPGDLKAPIAEVSHCPLAFAGVHLQKDQPNNAQVAYHYCKPVHGDVSQCLLYDGTGPDARLIGVESLVGPETFRAMSEAERAYWHDHTFEVDSGLLRSLTQRGDAKAATLAKVRTLYGKITHTWVSGKAYPEGPSKLFWAVTGQPPFLAPAEAKLPAEARRGPAPAQPAH